MYKRQKLKAKKTTCDQLKKLPTIQSTMSLLVIVCCCCGPITVSAVVVFDPTALLSEVLIPADAAVGSVIYRLRASDTAFDYPLVFTVRDTSTVSVESLNCTRFNSVCQANLILRKKLEIGRFYDFRAEARNQRGQLTTMNCSFKATNATTPIERIFPGAPTLLNISENARRNTELGRIIAKGNANRTKAVYLELYGGVQFGIHQKLITTRDAEGTIILLSQLDYEEKTVHHLTVLANDPWTHIEEDTRNIAGWPLLVAVIDEQDTPPIFTLAPPTTTLSSMLKTGDIVLRVQAEDGDRGQPRPIRYYLDPNDPASALFEISEKTGEVKLAVPITQVLSFPTQGQTPILLKVIAEEVRSNSQEAPSQSTTVQLALIPPGIKLGSPMFGASEYHALLDENSPVGTVLDLPQAEIKTEPGDIITLELVNNNGTFDISPSVVEGFAKFTISVHDNRLLDYEARHYVECYIVAKELGKGNYTAQAKLVVLLNDVNDNAPQFTQTEYKGTVSEHSAIGTPVLIVEATDIDRQDNKVRYIELSGPGSELFNLDPETGMITVANSEKLDAETFSQINLDVKAADENGQGLVATAKVTISLLDINDNAPQFEKDVYEFILNTDRSTFTTQTFVKASDSDISPPNNVVKYELLTPIDNLSLNEDTGEVLIKKIWDYDELVTVKVRAYDNGIPRLYGNAEVRIYPPESKSRKMIFIVPGKHPDKFTLETTLSELTGGQVVVDNIRPYTGIEPGATYVTKVEDGDKSVIEATVHYTRAEAVDINRIQQILDDRYQQQNKISQQNEQTNQHTIIKEREETKIQQSSSGDLLWLLILLIVLAIVAAIILILCCICRPCPLYIPPKRRKIGSGDMVEKLVVKGSGHGRESKSVQVAEWFGRKEAWSAEKEHAAVTVDAEADSIRRHEMERGSDRGGVRQAAMRRQQIQHSQSMQHLLHNHQDNSREQLYIRDGNTDILRLITRAGGEPRRNSATAMDQQQYLVDSGKDILLRRFIDQQQAEAARTQVLLPNAVNRLQTEQEFLEASLRQQNALLRQLILDRERDLRLETQSLPAGAHYLSLGTQTDQDMATQTEPQYLRPPRRKVQSDLEISDNGSDDEIAIIKARAKRRHRVMKPRKIRTPIQEESEVEIVEKPYKQKSVDRGTDVKPEIKQTRTSELRQSRRNSDAGSTKTTRSKSSRSNLKKEVLREISASLDHSEESENGNSDKEKTSPELFYSGDSLDDISPRSDKTTDSGKYRRRSEFAELIRRRRSESLNSRLKGSDSPSRGFRKRSSESSDFKNRYRSESDLRTLGLAKKYPSELQKKVVDKNQSRAESSRGKEGGTKGKKPAAKRTSRYMEWYTKNRQNNEKQGKSDRRKSDTSVDHEKTTKPVTESRLFKETVSSSNKKVDSTKKAGPEHPLLQHSEHRYEVQYPKKRTEEDADSGIVLTKPEMAQKKSIFTIAYNDMHTSQLRPDSSINTP